MVLRDHIKRYAESMDLPENQSGLLLCQLRNAM